MAKKSALVFGIIFVLAGVLGFFMNPVIGFIAANTASSIIHIIVGIILLVVASKPAASMTLKTIGIIYVIWAILSFLNVNVGPASMATAWFYLVVGIVIAALGFASKKGMGSAPAAPMTPQM